MSSEQAIEYQTNPTVTDRELNDLFSASWPNHHEVSFRSVLRTSMAYVCALHGIELVGYVNVAWDGRSHAFLLDPTVHPKCRQGIGRELVLRAISEAKKRGVAWVHVDFEPQLRGFYSRCGFRASEAGVINVAG